MRKLMASLLLLAGTVAMASVASAADAPTPEQIRQAVNRTIPLFEKSLAVYPHHTSCFSCHHQGVPSFALSIARTRGYTINDKSMAAVARHTSADLRSDLDSYKKGKGQPGGVTRAAYALLALQSAGVKRDEVTAAVSGFLLQRDNDKGFWRRSSDRPPSEASDFTDTCLAVRALNSFAEKADSTAKAARIERARQWLEQATPKDTEDRVFQLWGLKEAGAGSEALNRCGKQLLAEQRENGGWSQLPGTATDAYATGSALTVLLMTGELSSDSEACRHAISYLIQKQEPDGSWHVVSRSKPFQPYFESGFPHGKDQFISMAASAWATAALVLAGPAQGSR